jgi:DNA sulfur modification protein DndD
MRINISGWSSRGLRCPDVDIDLRGGDGTPFHAVFLQMPNGTGKTTTLELLKATLSGEAVDWDDTRVRSFRRRGATNQSGQFKVKLLVDGKPLTFELELEFEYGRATCVTTRPGSGGIGKGWTPPPEMRRFLARSFLDLFIFNGELANALFEDKSSAENAIDALCQLYLLEELAGQADQKWQDRVASVSGPKTTAQLTALQTKRSELGARKALLQRTRKKAVEDMATAKTASDALEATILAKTAGHVRDNNDLADARTAEATANAAVKEAVTSLHKTMRLPLALSPAVGRALTNWKNHLEELKLPEATSAQFFTDLLRQADCICGTSMTDVMREQIDARSKLVLSTEENGQLNIIKKDIEKYERRGDEGSRHDEMQEGLKTLSGARRSQLECQQTVRALRRKILDEGGDEVKELEKQQAEFDTTYSECESMVARIDGPGLNLASGEPVFSLAKIERDLKDIDDKITEATDTVELRAKTGVIQAVVKRAEELARRTIKEELLAACNDRLREILSDDPIELEAIDGHLRLAGQDRGSEAQTLSVGYTFLMTLLERGDNRFPLLVDSPVGKMDGSVRRRVGRLIPGLCSQFVTFVINTERADFVASVEKSANSVSHMTFFRKTPGNQRLLADLPPGRFVETDTGVLVDDEGYFDTFDMEEEGH